MNKFLFIFLSIIFVTLLSSTILNSTAEKLVVKDKFSNAQSLYKISKALNPFSKRAEQGLLAISMLRQERKGDSEETNFEEKEISLKSNTAVLGANIIVPVLMYHYIRVNPNPNDRVGFNLSVTPSNFDAQMDYLSSHGYSSITLDELGAALFSGAKLPKKPIVITFDDGYKDAYTAAFPILKSHAMKAVNFIITGFVGGPNFLSWDNIKEMKDNGVFAFGSHTVNHVALTYATNQRIAQELTDSKNILQSHLGLPINWLAYPYGNVSTKVAALTQQAGYTGAFGTNLGSYQSTDNLYTLPRIRVGGSDTVSSFASKLPY